MALGCFWTHYRDLLYIQGGAHIKPDQAHQRTDRELDALEKRIASEYQKAARELQDKINAYFQQFEKRDAQQLQRLKEGKITPEYYRQWRLAQIGRGKRFQALRDKIAQRMTQANETAAAYINDRTPGIYSLNRNYAAYTIEQQAGADVGFDLWDEQTVKRLIVEQPDLMPCYPPKRAVKRGIDLQWGKRQITAQVTTGILQGESIPRLADRLQKNIPEMNRASAVRAARTAITGAQNAGRMDSYRAAEEMGIQLKKQWMATLDNRTRHAHAALDGQTQPTHKPFHSELGDIMYPGDPNAAPSNVYNCRCTLVADLDGADMPAPQRRARDPITGESEIVENMTYEEWYAAKKNHHGAEAVEAAGRKGTRDAADRKQFEEYKAVLGKNAPKTFAGFQDLKYNNSEKWAQLKTMKRQTVFVENAPCVTTPKKYTEYFLKPGAKHADDFFYVGYTQDNPLQLRYDMARQFDIRKAVDRAIDKDGVETFNIYMKLGITEQKSFLTGWRIDKPGEKPRIITGFRKRGKEDEGV